MDTHKWAAVVVIALAGCSASASNSGSRTTRTSAFSLPRLEASATRPRDAALETSAARMSLDVLLAAWVASQPGEEPNERLDVCPLFDAAAFAAQTPATYSPPSAKTILGVSGFIDKDGPALGCIGGSDEEAATVVVVAAPSEPFETHIHDFLGGDTQDLAIGEVADVGGGTLHAFSYSESGVDDGARSASAWINGDLEIVLAVEGTLSGAETNAWLTGLLPIVITGVERATPENSLSLDTDASDVQESRPPPTGSSELDTASAGGVVRRIVGDGEFRALTSGCPMGEPSELLAHAPIDFASPSQIGEVSNWINDGEPTIGCQIRDGAVPHRWRVRFIVEKTGDSSDDLRDYDTAPGIHGGDLHVRCKSRSRQCKVVWRDVNLTVELYAESYTVTAESAIQYLTGSLPEIVERLSNADPDNVTLDN